MSSQIDANLVAYPQNISLPAILRASQIITTGEPLGADAKELAHILWNEVGCGLKLTIGEPLSGSDFAVSNIKCTDEEAVALLELQSKLETLPAANVDSNFGASGSILTDLLITVAIQAIKAWLARRNA